MPAVADFMARHALSLLLLVALLWLLVTAASWHLIRVYGPRLWTLMGKLWAWWVATPLAQWLERLPLAGRVMTHTMTAMRYLGLHAVFGFIIAIGALAAFFELADEIGVSESLGQFDLLFADALARHLSDDVLRAFSIVTVLGDRNVLIALATLVTLLLLLKRRWLLAGSWAFATAAGGLLNMLLKAIFARPRPFHDHGFVAETSFSFPSGHASGSMLVYSLLGYLIVRHTAAKWHIPIAIVMVAIIIFVGSSRVILQVHYVSDVFAGYASAAAWVALCIAGWEATERRR